MLRLKLPNERHPCANGCDPAGECMYEVEPSMETERILRQYRLCRGDLGRFCWPRGGGPNGESSMTVYLFSLIDGILAEDL